MYTYYIYSCSLSIQSIILHCNTLGLGKDYGPWCCHCSREQYQAGWLDWTWKMSRYQHRCYLLRCVRWPILGQRQSQYWGQIVNTVSKVDKATQVERATQKLFWALDRAPFNFLTLLFLDPLATHAIEVDRATHAIKVDSMTKEQWRRCCQKEQGHTVCSAASTLGICTIR